MQAFVFISWLRLSFFGLVSLPFKLLSDGDAQICKRLHHYPDRFCNCQERRDSRPTRITSPSLAERPVSIGEHAFAYIICWDTRSSSEQGFSIERIASACTSKVARLVE